MKVFDEEGIIDSDVQDILYELGNVGLGMASIAVGRIMGVRMHIGVPSIVPVDNELVHKLDHKKNQVGILLDFQKTLKGFILFIFENKFVDEVISKMIEEHENEIGQLEDVYKVSIIEEFTNIIGSAYLKAIGQYTGIRIYVKFLGVKTDNALELLVDSLELLEESSQKSICVGTNFSIAYDDGTIKKDVGHVIMLPNEESVEKLIKPLFD